MPASQDQIRESGHAIEARITAERADQNFRPDAGLIVGYREPPAIRVDSGVAAGSEITLFYDSLLAKSIAAGETREIARARLVAGLREFTIFGPATTISFLVDALDNPIFASGQATTGFIDDAFPDGWTPARPHARLARAAAALLALAEPLADERTPSAWTRLSGFRVLGPAGGAAETRLVTTEGAETARLTVQAQSDGGRRVIDAQGEMAVDVRVDGQRVEIETEGRIVSGTFERSAGRVRVTLDGEVYDIGVEPEAAIVAGAKAGGAGSGAVLAPMPGVVAEVKVAVGDAVEVGQVVIVLESMKLFTSLSAQIAGAATDITCRAGETVAAGKRLMLIEPQTSP